ncbi:MAG: HypC/HybG/HupF family hydrogenase formation chaperone [Sulfuricurvum sp.]|uniref:HypC/HybG/HupF family hydrogenase formation chaperone n=1 Tax=Sulfuricurvum sp. TaxID=2025608 RepID=UPI0026224A64|nr:HypC/HybG/HupF family hydrogenase formation chaperone [Sulfuricurvum sp.]MDD5159133.1 HypC/HybG/HupF family hydrogenase formation chaperone [Sulfuricurvum sp.]
MCLSIPSKVVSIDTENNVATVDTMGIQRTAGLDLMEEGSVQIGDYVLLHIGFIMNKIDEEDALESLRVYQEILEKLDEEDRRQLVLNDDNCVNREAP